MLKEAPVRLRLELLLRELPVRRTREEVAEVRSSSPRARVPLSEIASWEYRHERGESMREREREIV